MDRDQDNNPMSRVQRTFWTFWNYLTETVNRFLRPEPFATEINAKNTTQDGSVNDEHLDGGHTNHGTPQKKDEEEEQHFAPASSLISSRPCVFWDTESGLETENVQHSSGDEEYRIYKEEEEVDETGVDVANLPISYNATEDKEEELRAEDVMTKTCEDKNIGSHWETKDSFAAEETDKTLDIDQVKEMDTQLRKEDFSEPHTSFGLETDNTSKLETVTALQQNVHSKVNNHMAQSNQDLEGSFPETLAHAEFKVSDDNCGIVSEGKPSIYGPEHTEADRSDESANDQTEDDKEKPGKQMDEWIFYTNYHNEELNSEEESLSTSVTARHEEGSWQEEARAFKNIPPGKCEGQDFGSQEPYSLYTESQEGVPEDNNEAESDESAKQRFLEVGNCREVQTTLLQEEVESSEVKHLQNSSSEAGLDSFEETGLMETEATKISFEVDNAGSEKKTTLREPGLDSFMKTEAETREFHLEEETKEILVEFEMGEMKGIETKMTGFTEDTEETKYQKNETVFLDQSTDGDDLCETLPQKKSTDTEDKSYTEMQYTGIHWKDREEDLCTLEKEITEDKMCERKKEKCDVQLGNIGEDELMDVGNCEISANNESYQAEDTCCMLEQETESKNTEVIDDDILDLWIQQTSMPSQDEVLPELPDETKMELNSGYVCDANVSSSTAESGFFDQCLDMWGSHECKKHEEQNISCPLSNLPDSEDTREFSITESALETPWKEDLLSKHLSQGSDTSPESRDDEAPTLQNPDAEVSTSSKFAAEADGEPVIKMRTLFEVEAIAKDQLDTPTEGLVTYGCHLPLQEKPQHAALLGLKGENKAVDASKLDFSPQKSRIAIKNPRLRRPKDPRSLLHKPSLEHSPTKQLPSHVPAGVPLGGLGIGVKLPGLGAGFPVLKKTKKTVEEETETSSQETEENDDAHKQGESHHKPKWMPPKHPGFGNPFMSELKNKLKKTTKE